MNNIRNFIIFLISWIVKKIPFLFSYRLRYYSERYFKYKNDLNLDRQGWKNIKTYSLLDPRLKWKAKAVSTVMPLTSEDTKNILKWKSSTEIFREVNHQISLVNSCTYNLGWFEVGKTRSNSRMKATCLGIKSTYIKHCELYLVGLEGGKNYLSIYWFLTKAATCLIKDVDISHVPLSSVKYITCNPFSKNYGLSSHSSKIGQAKKLITNNLNAIFEEAKILESTLQKLINVPNISPSVSAIDIHIDDEDPYFINFEKDYLDRPKGATFRVDEFEIHRYDKLCIKWATEEDKEFYVNNLFLGDESKFEYLFLKSQVNSEVDEHRLNDFENSPCHPHDSHHLFLLLSLTNNKFKNLDRKYSNYIISNYSVPSKSYEMLYNAYREASVIESDLNSILKSGYMFEADKYLKQFTLNTEYFLKELSQIKTDIELKKKSANELVQSGNLKYQKRMYILVAALAALQLIVAVISLRKGL